MIELTLLLFAATILWVAVTVRTALDRQARAIELLLSAPTHHARDHDEELRRRAREIMRGRVTTEERGAPPIILDDAHEAALEERAFLRREEP